LTSWGSDPEIVDVEREMENGRKGLDRTSSGEEEAVSADIEIGYEGTGRENRASRVEDGLWYRRSSTNRDMERVIASTVEEELKERERRLG
jgi:hypothetical protein